ncbi:unnamed protein product, partial [Sphagnum compactum]
LLKLPPNQFKLVIDSIVWSFKHTIREIGDMGLEICLELLQNFQKADREISNRFYQTFLLSLLSDIFFVLTDTDHKSGFKLQCQTLAHVYHIVQTGKVLVPLFDQSLLASNPSLNNVVYLEEFSRSLLLRAFPHVLS